MEFWFPKVVSKYLNSSTLPKELLSIFILWIHPTFWSRGMTMYLVLSAFTSNPKQQNTDVLPSVSHFISSSWIWTCKILSFMCLKVTQKMSCILMLMSQSWPQQDDIPTYIRLLTHSPILFWFEMPCGGDDLHFNDHLFPISEIFFIWLLFICLCISCLQVIHYSCSWFLPLYASCTSISLTHSVITYEQTKILSGK